MKIKFIVLLLLLVSTALSAGPIDDWQVQDGYNCSQGYTRVKEEDLKDGCKQEVCHKLLPQWGVAQLAEDKLLLGNWFGCTVFPSTFKVNKSLCKPSTEPTPFYSDLNKDTQDLFLALMDEYHQHKADTTIAPHNVHLVDFKPRYDTYLVRGSSPVDGKEFKYDNLTAAIQDAAVAAGVPVPTEMYIIDVSLLNSIISPSELVEQAFFNDHPNLGKVINHPVYGALSNPNTYPEVIRRKLVDKASPDHVPSLVEQLNTLMEDSKQIPVVIYVHCEAGKDRTGEVMAGYRMHYQMFSYKEALAEANEIAGRDISIFNKYGTMWLGYWLLYKRGIDVGPIE